MSISHIGGGDADDDKPEDAFDMPGEPYKFPDIQVAEYGISIPVSPGCEGVLREMAEHARVIRDVEAALLYDMHFHFEHSLHERDFSPNEPQCPLCFWSYRLRAFWFEVLAWIEADADARRPRCQETRDGMVSVIHHVEPCTCHEECDGDEWD